MTEQDLARAIYDWWYKNTDDDEVDGWLDEIEEGGDLTCVVVDGHLNFIALARAVLDIVGKETGK